jgi:hypothetical protein
VLFIEAEGNNAPQFRVEFHPRVTVVSKLTPEMRLRLAASLRAALFGDPVDLVMNVDVGGVPQPLTSDLLARLGLQRRPLDNVVSAADLPGAVVLRQPVEDPATQMRVGVGSTASEAWNAYNTDPIHEPVHDGPLFEARNELAEAEANLRKIAERLDAARLGRTDETEAQLRDARASLKQARARVAEMNDIVQRLEQTLPPQRESKVVRVIKLRHSEADINERIHQLRGSLHAPAENRSEVQGYLDAAVAEIPPEERAERRNRLALLSERYYEDRALFEKLEHQPRPPSWLIRQTEDQIDEAQARITAFTYQIKEGIDVRKQLKRAQEQLREAQEAWDELENGVEGELRSARSHLDESSRNVAAFLLVEPDADLDDAIELERELLENAVDARSELVEALVRQGVDATSETAMATAQQWLDHQDRLEASHAAVQQQLAAALLDLGDIRRQIFDVSAEPEPVEDPLLAVDQSQLDVARANYDAAVHVAEAAAEEVARLESRPVVDSAFEIDALERAHHEALEVVEAAGRKVDYFARLDALRHDDAATLHVPQSQEVSTFSSFDAATSEDEYGGTVGVRPWWEGGNDQIRQPAPAHMVSNATAAEVDVSRISEEDVEMYVLSRAAGLRMAARGESVPLIIDAAFDDLPPHLVVRLFAALAKISSMVQVVYLSSGHVAEDWVKRQNEMLAAKVQVDLL